MVTVASTNHVGYLWLIKGPSKARRASYFQRARRVGFRKVHRLHTRDIGRRIKYVLSLCRASVTATNSLIL
eukprot:scaffold106892_cov18-Prasinocladus_malaysianus.AAC.1